MLNQMLIESLNQFKFDSTRFQQAFDIFLRFQRYPVVSLHGRFATPLNVIISRS